MFLAELCPEADAKVGVIPSVVSDLNQQKKVIPQGDLAFFGWRFEFKGGAG